MCAHTTILSLPPIKWSVDGRRVGRHVVPAGDRDGREAPSKKRGRMWREAVFREPLSGTHFISLYPRW